MSVTERLRRMIATAAAIRPLHLKQSGNPYPHSAVTHDALREHHEGKAARYSGNAQRSQAHRAAAAHHAGAVVAIQAKSPDARSISSKAHSFASSNRLD